MDENKDKHTDGRDTKEDDSMNATVNTSHTYNEKDFLTEFEESLKEMVHMKNNKNSPKKSTWRELFNKKEK
jgi:hypothetical protein